MTSIFIQIIDGDNDDNDNDQDDDGNLNSNVLLNWMYSTSKCVAKKFSSRNL